MVWTQEIEIEEAILLLAQFWWIKAELTVLFSRQIKNSSYNLGCFKFKFFKYLNVTIVK